MSTYADPTVVVTPSKPNTVQPAAILALIAGIVALLVAGYFFGVNQLTSKKLTDTKATLTERQRALDALNPTATDLATMDSYAKGLHVVFDKQQRWNGVLNTIQTRLYKNMVVTSMQLTDKGQFILSGTTPTYNDYAKIYASFTDSEAKKYFVQARPTSVARIGTETLDGVGFTFELTLSSDMLNLKNGAVIK